jgi:RimJ/RimL family protein N-acetyltransferase
MIRGEKVTLRAREQADSRLQHRWSNDPDVMRFMGMRFPTPGPRDPAPEPDPAQYLALVIETLEGEPIGTCGLRVRSVADRNASIGIMIGKKRYWSHGYGADALLAVCGYGFNEMHLHRIHLAVFSYNTRGIRCYEKCGFKHEVRYRQACFREGRYHDVLVMAMLEDEYRTLWPGRCVGAAGESGDHR